MQILKAIFFVISLCVLAFNAYGQNDTTLKVKGIVISKEDSLAIPYAHIININTRQGLAAHKDGTFVIVIALGDSLKFSAVGYNDTIICFDHKQYAHVQHAIALSVKTKMLDKVIVSPRGYGSDYLLRPERKPVIINGINNTSSLAKPRKPKPGIWNPASFLYEKYSKKEKEKRRLNKIAYQEQMEVYRQALKAEKVTAELMQLAEIWEEDYDAFYTYFDPALELLEKNSDYLLIIEMKKVYQEFLDYYFHNRDIEKK
jgi:hypothetical protein